ncbi:MAG: ankyrin repeat domain-containing protein [Kiritimatiellae bacterium]|nr:ankyrin repeat domain-containing protein [Kiritimatiellia bacterium]
MRRILPVFPVLAALFLAACESLPPPRDPAENLRLAAESGDMALFRRSVLEGADLDARDADGKTALILAAENGRTAIATNLLGGVTNWNPKAVPANGELRDRAGNTALLAAAGKNRAGTVGWLLACGADGDARTPDGETALMVASRRGFVATVKVLADGGIVSTNARQRGILQTYAPEKETVLHPVDLDARDKNGRTALMKAAEQGKREVAWWLLAKGASKTARDKSGMTALDWARYVGQEALEELLLGPTPVLETP